jgi:hypothetical protein
MKQIKLNVLIPVSCYIILVKHKEKCRHISRLCKIINLPNIAADKVAKYNNKYFKLHFKPKQILTMNKILLMHLHIIKADNKFYLCL